MWNLQASVAPQTQVFPQHGHCVHVDQSGNGQTTNDANHVHAVVAGVIQADSRDGHSHQIWNQPCAQARPVPGAMAGSGAVGGAPHIHRQGAPCGSCGGKR